MCFSRPLIAALVFLALPAIACAQDWVTMGQFTKSINCTYFLPTPGDPVIGFVGTGDFESGQGEIYRTSDSGHSWIKTNFQPRGEESVTDISFKDVNTGWATTLTARNDLGHVYRTTDGGQSWEQTSANAAVYLGLGYSAASHLLFAARGGSAALVSSDDGKTWRPSLEATVTSFGFVDDSIGFASGSHRYSAAGSSFATTRDGGRTWRYSTLNKECYQPLLLPRSHEIYAIDEGSGTLYTSRDLGETWDTTYRFSAPREWMSGCIRGNKCGRLYAQSGYSNSIGLVVSEDKGRSWRDLRPSTINAPVTNTIDTRFFVQGDVVYAAKRAEIAGSMHTLYRYRRLVREPSAGSGPYAIDRTLVLQSLGCEYVDTTITIAYPNDCAAATLIQASCSDNTHFQLLGESLPKRLSNVTSLHVAYLPTDGDTVHSYLALAYQIGDATIADTVWLTGCLRDGLSLTRLQLSEKANKGPVIAGDTITLNIELRDPVPQGLALDSLECTVTFDGDLLSALQPIGNVNWRLTSSPTKTSNAITIRLAAQSPNAPSGAIVAQVPLRVMLSLDTTAHIRLDKIRWYGDSFTGCQQQYASSLFSLPISREASCDDRAVMAFMSGGYAPALQLKVQDATIDATITVLTETPAEISIVNALGNRLSSSHIVLTGSRTSLRLTRPMVPGVYYVVLDAGRTLLTRKFIVE